MSGLEQNATVPVLGVGLGYRAPFKSNVFLHRPRIDFLEITADHFWEGGRIDETELDLLREHFALIPHAIGLSLGSAEGLDEDYLHRLAAIVRCVDPPYWSEHIAFTKAGGVDIGHLTPLPFTHEAVEVLCRNIDRARRAIDLPLILENITYHVRMPGSKMTETQFLTEVLGRSGCGMLLDVTNLYTNAVNHGHDAAAMLRELPCDRVVQLHLAGGFWSEDVLVDSHSHAVAEPVWQLLEQVLDACPVKAILLERDEDLPPFDEILGELDRARRMFDACRQPS